MADVIIIGAGLVGCSIAHQLAAGGYAVTVVDKAAAAGHGSTSASSGVVRFNYSTYDSVALAWESQHAWLDWRAHVGATSDESLARFHRIGMLMMDVPLLSLERNAELLRSVGVPCRVLGAEQIAALIPGVDTGRYWPNKRIDDPAFWEPADDVICGMLTPDGGYVDDPALAALNLADAARRHGAIFRFRASVTGVTRSAGHVTGVTLDDGSTLHARIVVNAAGPWSARVNELAGVGSGWTVTTAPMRQEVHHVPAPPGFDPAPVVGDLDLGVYFRPDGAGSILVGGTEPECDPLEWVGDPDAASLTPTQRQFEAQVTRLARRLPELGIPNAPSGVVGIYDVSTDWAPIYDATELSGFYVAIGTSGNQFKNGPVIGQLMRALIDAVESGHNHDKDPVVFRGPRTGIDITLGAFSRIRPDNPDSTGTVMG